MPKDPDTAPPASASERAQAMRERLGAQRVADDLLAEASQLRGAAAADADSIVAEAESVAEQLLTEAREAADKLTTEAQERADGILARAYFEAEDLQRHTEEERARIREEVQSAGRAEVEDFRTRSAGLLDSAEDGLRDVLRSLDELRNGPSEETSAPAEEPEVRELTGAAEPELDPQPEPGDPEARPLGWLFRTSQA
jgi:vacuolar-type H+-ATPase subunit H